jgi:Ni,Fe-hydrogenase III small subunit
MTITVESPLNVDEEKSKLKGALLHDIRRSVYVYRVDCGGCNGCEIEIFASITPIFDAERFGIKVVGSPRHADVLVYTGAMTRAMRMPAIRAYNAAPDPKIVVAYGACGSSGGIFHDLYCVWGGADRVIPVDLYIPGCPPTPPATIYGFTIALGLLKQKIQTEHYTEAEGEQVPVRFPKVPVDLRVAVEREARCMAGYWHGKQIADQFLEIASHGGSKEVDGKLQEVLAKENDPRLSEIMNNLHQLYLDY